MALTTTASAFTVSSELEAVRAANVGFAGQSVTFENTYARPVPVCTYNLRSSANPSAAVRISGLSGTGMTVRIQQFENSSVVTPGDVHCLIAEEGAHQLPDGRRFEAHTVLSRATNGQNAVDGWSLSSMEDVSGLIVNNYTAPTVLGQVITSVDARASVFFTTDCDNRRNEPFLSGMADGICVSKHIGQISGSRANETLGFIVFEGGSGTFGDISYSGALGPNSVAGVGNSPPYSYTTGGDFEVGVATQSGENGGNGGWAVLYGLDPLANGQIDLAIEEEVVQGDTSRTHINERVAYWAFRRLPEFEIRKSVDLAEIAEPRELTYTIELENTARLPLTSVMIADTLPDGTAATLSGPTESLPLGTANVLESGETWTYTATFTPTQAAVTTGSDLTNTVSANNAEYTSLSLPDETATAITTIVPPVPALQIAKSADDPTTPRGAGDAIAYRYRVTNTGNITLLNVSVTDAHNATGPPPTPDNEVLETDAGPAGDSTDTSGTNAVWDRLAPGDTVLFTGTYSVTQSDVDLLSQ